MKYLRKFENHTDYEAATLDLPNVSYCVQLNEVHYNPFKEYEYVDLGLPSGLLWATCNIGADNPYDRGLYFAWGETEGYSIDQLGIDKSFTWEDYKYGTESNITKYNLTDEKKVLDSTDDAAKINMKDSWRIPTLKEYNELFNNVTHLHTSGNPFYQELTSKNNGNTLIFPCCGYCYDGTNTEKGMGAYYWINENSLYTYGDVSYMLLDSIFSNSYTFPRCYGLPIRGVKSSLEEDDLYPYSAILNPTDDFTQKPKVTIFSDKPIYSQREYNPIIYFEDTYEINYTYSNDSYYGKNAAFMKPNSNYTINVNYPNGIIKAISGVTGYDGYCYEINENGIEFSREISVEPL